MDVRAKSLLEESPHFCQILVYEFFEKENVHMKKHMLTLLMAISPLLLTGCASSPAALHLEVDPKLWQSEHFGSIDGVDSRPALGEKSVAYLVEACTSKKGAVKLPDTYRVLDSYFLARKPSLARMADYSYSMVTLFGAGENFYAHCQAGQNNGFYKRIDPDKISELRRGAQTDDQLSPVKISLLPVEPETKRELEEQNRFMKKDKINQTYEIDTITRFSLPAEGHLLMTAEVIESPDGLINKPEYVYHVPLAPTMDELTLWLRSYGDGFNQLTVESDEFYPDERTIETNPVAYFDEGIEKNIKLFPLPSSLDAGDESVFSEVTLTKSGKTVQKIQVRLSYSLELPDGAKTVKSPFPDRTLGVFAAAHKKSLSADGQLEYPDLNIITTETAKKLYAALKEEAAEADRLGKLADLPYLTIGDGNKTQQFEVYLHPRMNKTDVYLYDRKRDLTFKLGGEDMKAITDELWPEGR